MGYLLNKAKDKETILNYIDLKEGEKKEVISKYLLSRDFIKDIKLIEKKKYIIQTPQRKSIKKNNGKTRYIYEFVQKDAILAAYIVYLLNIDTPFPSCIFSYRQNTSFLKALQHIRKVGNVETDLKGYSIDISSYDQNIDKTIASNELQKYVKDEEILYLINSYINDNSYYDENNNLKKDAPGIRPGIAFTNYIENIYLLDLDNYILNNSYKYARYCDDIVFFVENNIEDLKNEVIERLNEYHLIINQDKINYLDNHNFEYLGYNIINGNLCINRKHKKELEKMIKRKTNHFLKLKRVLCLCDNDAMSMAINYYKKFALVFSVNFPYIGNIDDIRNIDRLIQNSIRTIGSNKFNSKRYKIKISKLHELGYKSIVNNYYNRNIY